MYSLFHANQIRSHCKPKGNGGSRILLAGSSPCLRGLLHNHLAQEKHLGVDRSESEGFGISFELAPGGKVRRKTAKRRPQGERQYRHDLQLSSSFCSLCHTNLAGISQTLRARDAISSQRKSTCVSGRHKQTLIESQHTSSDGNLALFWTTCIPRN